MKTKFCSEIKGGKNLILKSEFIPHLFSMKMKFWKSQDPRTQLQVNSNLIWMDTRSKSLAVYPRTKMVQGFFVNQILGPLNRTYNFETFRFDWLGTVAQ